MSNLAYHLDGASREDLVLIAVHNGTAHSIVLPKADWTSLDDDLIFSLRDYALRSELERLHQ